jgi:hypothetical protein
MEVQEAKLVKEQAHGLCSFGRWDLPMELEELRTHATGIEDEWATEAGEPLALVVEASNALVDLGMLPMQDITQLLKTAQFIMKAVGLILECLREGHAFNAGPWD